MTEGLCSDSLTGPILDLVSRVERLLHRQASDPRQRILVALAGVPGSGKSTVSHALLQELEKRGMDDVAIVPMVSLDTPHMGYPNADKVSKDGFHYTKQALLGFQDPENAFRRRGAPFTFDVDSFISLVRTLKTNPVTSNTEPEQPVYAPSFDHTVQDPVENDIVISSRKRIVIVEGNYTLLNQKPWNEITSLCDEK